jgi:hypothetical protein
MNKDCEYPASEKNHIVSIGVYFGEKAVKEVSEATGGKRVLMEPVPKDERTPSK